MSKRRAAPGPGPDAYDRAGDLAVPALLGALARDSKCDELDGAEYNRVLKEWKEEGYPGWTPLDYGVLEVFICRHANIGPILSPPPRTGKKKGGAS